MNFSVSLELWASVKYAVSPADTVKTGGWKISRKCKFVLKYLKRWNPETSSSHQWMKPCSSKLTPVKLLHVLVSFLCPHGCNSVCKVSINPKNCHDGTSVSLWLWRTHSLDSERDVFLDLVSVVQTLIKHCYLSANLSALVHVLYSETFSDWLLQKHSSKGNSPLFYHSLKPECWTFVSPSWQFGFSATSSTLILYLEVGIKLVLSSKSLLKRNSRQKATKALFVSHASIVMWKIAYEF